MKEGNITKPNILGQNGLPKTHGLGKKKKHKCVQVLTFLEFLKSQMRHPIKRGRHTQTATKSRMAHVCLAPH